MTTCSGLSGGGPTIALAIKGAHALSIGPIAMTNTRVAIKALIVFLERVEKRIEMDDTVVAKRKPGIAQ